MPRSLLFCCALSVLCFACGNDDDVSAALIEDAVGTYEGFFTDTNTGGIVTGYRVVVSRQGDNELFIEPEVGLEFLGFAAEVETFNNFQLRTPPALNDSVDVRVNITVGNPVELRLTGSDAPDFEFRYEGLLQD